MRRPGRGLVALVIAFGASASPVAAQGQESIGNLLHHVRGDQGVWHQKSAPYVPGEGDMVFFNDHSAKWGMLYKMVGSDAPYHIGLIFKKPDGQCAICEAGPNDTLKCRVLELAPRLQGWEHTLLIRVCKKTLTPEQSAAMTQWCLDQNGKRYALGRLLLQATPVRCRAPLRKSVFGATYTDRDSYLCAELVIAGGTVGGIFDPQKQKGNTIYPRDVVQDDIHDLSALYHEARVWVPQPIGQR